MNETSEILRLAILGAGGVPPSSIIAPAKVIPEIEVVAVSDCIADKAKKFADKYGIPDAYSDNEEILHRPNIDAVYIAIPNSLHCQWAVKAMQAGKHVLCEKPMAANSQQVLQMRDVAASQRKILMEGFHYRYHPMADYMEKLLQDGEIGATEHIEATMCLPRFFLAKDDIRYRYQLGGGVTMDLGAYAINIIRFLAGAQPKVVSAEATVKSPQVDFRMIADFQLCKNDIGFSARMICAFSGFYPKFRVVVTGERGKMIAINPYAPHLFNSLKLENDRYKMVKKFCRDVTSYTYQLRFFRKAVLENIAIPTNVEDAIANMEVIDEVYRTANLKCRGE